MESEPMKLLVSIKANESSHTRTGKVEPQIYCSGALRNEDEGYDDYEGSLDNSRGAE